MRKGHSILPMLSGRWSLWWIAVSFSSMGNLFRNRVIQIKTRPHNHSMRLDVHSDIQYIMFIYLFFFSMIFSDMISHYSIFLFGWYIYNCILCFLFLSTSFIFVETSLHSYLRIFHYERGYFLNGLFWSILIEYAIFLSFHLTSFSLFIIVFCFHHVHVY